MRKLAAALAILSVSTFVYAERDDSREIQDLMYFPEAKTFYGVSTLDITTGTAEFDTDSGSSGDFDLFERVITQQIGYSFSDRFLAFTEISHRASRLETMDDQGSDGLAATSGLTNPTIGAKWRALDQKLHDVNVDVIPFITIETGDAETPGSDGDGNNKEGTSYGMEAQIGKKFIKDEFVTYVRLSHTTNYLAKNQTTDKKEEIGFTTSYELGGRYQRSLTDSLFLNASLGYLTYDSNKVYDDETNAFEKFDATKTYIFGLESIITPYPNLALALALELKKTKDYGSKTSGGNETDYEKFQEKTVTLWTRYQF